MHPLRALRERGNNTPEEVAALLSDDVEFHTPILTKVVTGREVISQIWALSSHVRSGHYVREHKLDERTTFLQWQGKVDGRWKFDAETPARNLTTCEQQVLELVSGGLDQQSRSLAFIQGFQGVDDIKNPNQLGEAML